MGGWVSNGYALWVWKGSPLDDGFCWYDFKLSYSDDYGATFTEAAVVRRGMHTTATKYRYSIGTVPEMSIVSQLQVSVCAPDSDTCHHTLKSTDASLGQYYRSRFEDRTAGANTRAVLVPTNSDENEKPGNAFVVGWLEIDDTETHTYRIAMTAGKTYTLQPRREQRIHLRAALQRGVFNQLQDPARPRLHGDGRRSQQGAAAESAQQRRLGDNRRSQRRRDGHHRAARDHGLRCGGSRLHGGRQDAFQQAGVDHSGAVADRPHLGKH